MNATYISDSPWLGAGACDVRGWKKTAEQESKQAPDTPSLFKVKALSIRWKLSAAVTAALRKHPAVHEKKKKQQQKN